MKNTNKIKDRSTIPFHIMKAVLLTILSILCVLPFIVIISGSLTDNLTILRDGFSLFPRNPTAEAYRTIFRSPDGIRISISRPPCSVASFRSTYAPASPLRIISLSCVVRWERPSAQRKTDSRTLVFPAAFSPVRTQSPECGRIVICA